MDVELIKRAPPSRQPSLSLTTRKENYREKCLPRAVTSFDRNQIDRLLAALDEGASVINNKINGKQTALHLLCESFSELAKESSKVIVDEATVSCLGMVRLMLECGADVNIADDAGASAIHYAAKSYKFPLVALQAMLSSYRDANLADSKGSTALHYACQVESIHLSCEKVQLLINSGCSLTRVNASGATPVNVLLLTLQNANESFLALPSRSAYGDIVDLIVDQFPATALKFKDSFLWPAVLGGSIKTVQFLFQNGAKPDEKSKIVSDFPLVLAAGLSAKDSDEKFALLLDKKYDPNVKGVKGGNVCHTASQQGNVRILEKAKELGVDFQLVDSTGATLLHKAARGGSKAFRTLNYLIENGFDVHAKNKLNRTPLYMALTAKNEKACALLVSVSSSIDLSSEQLAELHYEQLQLLSNPEPIIECHDPLLVSLQISRAFRTGARLSGAYKLDMEAKADSLEELAVEMIHAGTAKSARNVLSTGLIDYAVKTEMKRFVSSPIVQDFIEEIWQGSLYTGKASSKLKMAKEIGASLLLIVFLPYVADRLNVLHKSPLVAFTADLVSYFVFVVLLIVTFVFNTDLHDERDSLTVFDWIILAYVVGFLLQEVFQFARRARNGKATLYFKSAQNVFDVILLLIFIVYYVLLFLAFYTEEFKTSEFVRISYHLYGCAALGCCIRVLSFLKIHRVLGPVQLSFIGMLQLFFTFLVMLLIFMVGFSIAIASIYAAGPLSNDPSSNHTVPSLLDGFIPSFRTVFWSPLGDAEIDGFEADSRAETIVGSIVALIWFIISDRILLGLLFGLVFSKFDEIQENAETEYKFARSEIVMDYTFYPPMPVPFNVISFLFFSCFYRNSKSKRTPEFNRSGVEDMVRRYRRKESKKEASSEMKKVQDDLTSLKKTLESYIEKKKRRSSRPRKVLSKIFGRSKKDKEAVKEVEEPAVDSDEDSDEAYEDEYLKN